MQRHLLVVGCLSAAPALALTPAEELGKQMFFDGSLSVNGNQPCSFCHDPGMGFSSPHAQFNGAGSVVEGSVPGRFGNRKPPTAAYAGLAPVLHHVWEDGDILFVGGAFHDGRATGAVTGNVAADQAMGPFLNPVEMGMPHAACVVQKACEASARGDYPVTMQQVWGKDVCAIDFPADLAGKCADPDAGIEISDEGTAGKIDDAFRRIAHAIGAYERSSEVNRFSSRYDDWVSGKGTLSAQEQAGLVVFEGKAMCAECHVIAPGPEGGPALFTDFTYDNLGVPRNPENPWYAQAGFNPKGSAWIDRGLADTVAADPALALYSVGQEGKQKVPTLRNIDARTDPDTPRAYMHNGYFKTLEGVVRFYNLRDVWPRCDSDVPEAEALARKCWPAPEVAANVNKDELGNLKLTDQEEADLVAFLKTLTDR